MKEVPLSRGYAALVDDADHDRVIAAGPWFADITPTTVYAVRNMPKPDGKKTTQLLHRFILGMTDPKVKVDHRNRYGLDCRRENLRVGVTRSQNMANSRKPCNGKSSQFKGVHWNKQAQKWCARIKVNGRTLHLGYFTDELEAARTYDQRAREQWGEFSRGNLGRRVTTP